jgi:anti-sigma regulatory factor (Ser/Thr protein kinase)
MVADRPEGQAQADPARQEGSPLAGQEDGMRAVPPPLNEAFDGPGALYRLRAEVAAHASAAGLSPSRVYDVVAAAHEMAANAVRHGAGNGRLRLYSDGLALYCEVSDPGAVNGEVEPGEDSGGDPPWPVRHGHGLWVIGQVADRFTVDNSPAGTTVTACFGISPPQNPEVK